MKSCRVSCVGATPVCAAPQDGAVEALLHLTHGFQGYASKVMDKAGSRAQMLHELFVHLLGFQVRVMRSLIADCLLVLEFVAR